jgi:hypothetical protein
MYYSLICIDNLDGSVILSQPNSGIPTLRAGILLTHFTVNGGGPSQVRLAGTADIRRR